MKRNWIRSGRWIHLVLVWVRAGLDALVPEPIPPRYRQAVAVEALRSASYLIPAGSLPGAMAALIAFLSMRDLGHFAFRLGLLSVIWCSTLGLMVVSLLVAQTLRGRDAPFRYRATVRLLALVQGCAWGTLPIALFAAASSDMRVMVACICAGLIATSLAFVSVSGATEAMAVPLIVASYVTLIRTGGPTFVHLSYILVVYGGFILLMSWRMRGVSIDYILSRLMQQEQQTTLQMLLGGEEQAPLSWIWETDAEGRLCFVAPDLAVALRRPVAEIEGQVLSDLLRSVHEHPDEDGLTPSWDRLQECLSGGVAFRGVVVEVDVRGAVQHWSLTGRPLFDAQLHFSGFKGFASDVTGQLLAQRQAAFRAHHDALTGLPNRHALAEALRSALNELGRSATPFGLLSLDLDHFKVVNDRLGHRAGDMLLREVSQRMLACLGERDMLIRFGGDEFVLLSRGASVSSVDMLARRLVQTCETPFTIWDEPVSVGMSIGIAMAPAAGDTAETLIEAADLALYRAKHAGGQTWRFFENAFRRQVEQRRDLLRDLRQAVTDQTITLTFQPVVDAHTLAVKGFETLARWRRPGHGLVSPDRFIKLAEEAGLIEELGGWILDRACAAAQFWPQHLRLAVNVSVGQLYSTRFVGEVAACLARYGIAASRLDLEITETVFMDAEGASFGVLQALRDLGVKIVLDDFGRGFSSLGFLKGFEFSKIKIDSGFVRDMMHDQRSASIVHAVIALAAEMGIVVTAEGVETVAQLTALRRQGCTQAQGYLFSEPVPVDHVSTLLARLRPSMLGAKDYVFDLAQ